MKINRGILIDRAYQKRTLPLMLTIRHLNKVYASGIQALCDITLDI